jgi:predicted DNA-binding protein
MTNRNDHLSIRVPGELKAALQKLAGAEHRTLADYVYHVLRKDVEAGKPKRKSPEPGHINVR